MKRLLLLLLAGTLALSMLPLMGIAEDTQGTWETDLTPITFDVYFSESWWYDEWTTDQPTRSSTYITDKTGVSINFIAPTGDRDEATQRMIAGGDVYDIMLFSVYDPFVKGLEEAGLLLNLLDLADTYDKTFYDVVAPSQIGWFSSAPGVLYSYPNFADAFEQAMAMPDSAKRFLSGDAGVGVRKDIYDALGRPDMTTIDGFLSTLAAAQELYPEVDGLPLIPIHLMFEGNGCRVLDSYLPQFLAQPITDENGMFDRFADPAYIDWLKAFRKAYDLGLISRDSFTDKREQVEEKLSSGRYFMVTMGASDLAMVNNDLYAVRGGKDTGVWYEVAEAFHNPAGDAPHLHDKILLDGWKNLYISKNCKDPARAIRFLNYVMGEEGQRAIWFGIEGVTYDVIDGADVFRPFVYDGSVSWEELVEKYFVYGQNWAFWNNNLQNTFARPEEWRPKDGFDQYGAENMYFRTELEGTYSIDSTLFPDEALIDEQVGLEWGTTLPKLIMAESDEAFDAVLNAFLKLRDEMGYDRVLALRYDIVQANREKLGIK